MRIIELKSVNTQLTIAGVVPILVRAGKNGLSTMSMNGALRLCEILAFERSDRSFLLPKADAAFLYEVERLLIAL
jgi:hypothetical protein